MDLLNAIKKNEGRIFFLLVVASTFPLLLNTYFPTLDGPAHIYNAHLTWQLIWGSPVLESYLTFHPTPVPNWITNALLTPLCQILPAYLAEKTILLLYVIGFPLSFRYLIHSIKGNSLCSFYIFPFLYSNMMMSGFYNFSFGVAVCFFSLGYFFKYYSNLSIKHYGLISLLLLTVYFSHIFVAAFCIALMIAYPVADSFLGGEYKITLTKNIQKSLFLFLAALPTLVLCVAFSQLQPDNPSYYTIPTKELVNWIVSIRPIIAHKMDLEGIFTRIIFIILSIHLLVLLIKSLRINDLKSIKLFFILLPILLLILTFILPDGDGWAGYISIRTLFLFFTFLLIALSLFHIPEKLQLSLIGFILIAHFLLLARKNASLMSKQFYYTELTTLAESIEPHSIVGTVDLSEDYRTAHISNYLGTFKPMVITENYEATTGYFPLQWKRDIPAFKIGSLTVGEGNIQGVLYTQTCTKNTDYVLLMGELTESRKNENKALFEQLQLSYYLIRQTGFFSLYKLR